MKHILFLLSLIVCGNAFGIPLSSWSTWSTNYPYVSRQVPPNALIVRGIGTNDYYVLEVDPATGELPVALSGGAISIDFSGPTGDPVPADAGFVGGVDPNGDLRGLAVDVDGRLQIDAVTDNDFTGPTGDPVPAEAGYVAGIDGTGDLQGLAVDTSGQLQIDVISSALPTGAATEAKQDSEITQLTTIAGDTTSIDTKTPALGQAAMAASVPVAIANDQSTLPVEEGPKAYADSVYYSYASGNVTTGAWVQLIASTAAIINLVCITDQSGQAMELGVGAPASESRVFLIAPGFSGCIPLGIAAGSRLAIQAVSATASTGAITISGMN